MIVQVLEKAASCWGKEEGLDRDRHESTFWRDDRNVLYLVCGFYTDVLHRWYNY